MGLPYSFSFLFNELIICMIKDLFMDDVDENSFFYIYTGKNVHISLTRVLFLFVKRVFFLYVKYVSNMCLTLYNGYISYRIFLKISTFSIKCCNISEVIVLFLANTHQEVWTYIFFWIHYQIKQLYSSVLSLSRPQRLHGSLYVKLVK